jgi:hypothetical protein
VAAAAIAACPIASTQSRSRAPRCSKFDRLLVVEQAGVELDIRPLVDTRERLVRTRTALNNAPLWHLAELTRADHRARARHTVAT